MSVRLTQTMYTKPNLEDTLSNIFINFIEIWQKAFIVTIKNDVILAYHWLIKKYTGLSLVIQSVYKAFHSV